jgi:Flp pilus assembly protein TadD
LNGDAQNAAASFQRAIALKPEDASAHYQLARALERLGKKDDARQEFQRFAQLKKAQPDTGGMATGRVQ